MPDDRNVTPSTTGLSDRLAEVRARLDAYKRDGYAAEIGDHFTADDIAWLLDEVERLRSDCRFEVREDPQGGVWFRVPWNVMVRDA